MIIGIGTDITEIVRIENAIQNNRFLEKYFTEKEIDLYERRSRQTSVLAGNFAVKEAVSKAFMTGFRGFAPKDIEVLRDEMGAPYIVLYRCALQMAEKKKIKKIHVSISNSDLYAVAYVIAEG